MFNSDEYIQPKIAIILGSDGQVIETISNVVINVFTVSHSNDKMSVEATNLPVSPGRINDIEHAHSVLHNLIKDVELPF